MPRPRDVARRRLQSRRFRDGYAVVIGGIWYVRLGSGKRSTGLRDDGSNDAAVLELLDRFVEERLYAPPPTNGNGHVAPPADSFSDLAARFTEARRATMRASTWQCYEAAVAAVFPEAVALDFTSLVDYLARRKTELARRYAPNTVSMYLGRVGTILRYGVGRGDLPRNPLEVVGIPPVVARDEPRLFTSDEMRRLFRSMIRAGHTRTMLYCELMGLTAMRSFEAAAITRGSLRDGMLYIPGKGSRGKPVRVREFPVNPLELDPLLPPVSPVQRFYHDLWSCLERVWWLPTAANGRFFPDHYSTYTNHLKAAMRAIGIDPATDPRRLHVFRAVAEERWERLGFDATDIASLAGHSLPVYVARYRARQTGERTAERIRATLGK